MKTLKIKEGSPVYVFDGATIDEGIMGQPHPVLECYYVIIESPVYGKARTESKLCPQHMIFEDVEDLQETVLNQVDYLQTKIKDLIAKADY
jgi:hypothetical protein